MNDSAAHIDITQTVYPVVATANGRTELARPDFFGTAFAIAPGVFITAAHVVTAATSHGQVALAGPTRDRRAIGGAQIDDLEIFNEIDIALLFTNARSATILNTWLIKPVQVLTELSSYGYPHAVTRNNEHDRFEVIFRAYKGYTIATRSFDRLPAGPAVYEVSWPYPEGMSGAPVLLNIDDCLAVAGVVLGIETVECGGIDNRVGIALLAEEVLRVQSKKLGGLIPERLGFAGAVMAIKS